MEREGHAKVPPAHTEGDYGLGKWCSHQREAYNNGRLAEDRVERLEALGFVWNKLAARWEEGYAALQRFVEREGHANLPYDHIEGAYRLGTWCAHQRMAYSNGTLAEDRVERLEALGFVWNKLAAAWEEGYAALKQFVEREGHANLPNDHTEGDYRLGTWCAGQRTAYRKGTLADNRVERLEALGFVWNTFGEAWEEGYSALEAFVTREQHANVPYRHTEGDFRLGSWCGHQRKAYNNGRLAEDRVERLEALGFVWDVHEAAWQEGYAALQRLVEREGHANVPTGHTEGDYRLGSWCGHQREAYNNGRLAEDRVARLEALPGWVWDARRP